MLPLRYAALGVAWVGLLMLRASAGVAPPQLALLGVLALGVLESWATMTFLANWNADGERSPTQGGGSTACSGHGQRLPPTFGSIRMDRVVAPLWK